LREPESQITAAQVQEADHREPSDGNRLLYWKTFLEKLWSGVPLGGG